MIKRIVILVVLGTSLTGCFMAPMALLGPVTSGFTTASIMQSGITTTASYMVKRSTGKTISEHAIDTLSKEILQQAYFPKIKHTSIIAAPLY